MLANKSRTYVLMTSEMSGKKAVLLDVYAIALLVNLTVTQSIVVLLYFVNIDGAGAFFCGVG